MKFVVLLTTAFTLVGCIDIEPFGWIEEVLYTEDCRPVLCAVNHNEPTITSPESLEIDENVGDHPFLGRCVPCGEGAPLCEGAVPPPRCSGTADTFDGADGEGDADQDIADASDDGIGPDLPDVDAVDSGLDGDADTLEEVETVEDAEVDGTSEPDDGGAADDGGLEEVDEVADPGGTETTDSDGEGDTADADIGPEIDPCAGVDCSYLVDACHDAACDPATGQCEVTVNDGATCNDADPCTENDVCDASGTCAGVEMDCDDGNDCTVDSCVAGGCANGPISGVACDDGDSCTTGDWCAPAGQCSGEPQGWTVWLSSPGDDHTEGVVRKNSGELVLYGQKDGVPALRAITEKPVPGSILGTGPFVTYEADVSSGYFDTIFPTAGTTGPDKLWAVGFDFTTSAPFVAEIAEDLSMTVKADLTTGTGYLSGALREDVGSLVYYGTTQGPQKLWVFRTAGTSLASPATGWPKTSQATLGFSRALAPIAGGFLVAGTAGTDPQQVWVAVLDDDLGVVDQWTYPTLHDVSALIPADGGEFFVVGTRPTGEMYVMRVQGTTGIAVWSAKSYGVMTATVGNSRAVGATQTSDGGVVVGGGNGVDGWAVRVGSDGGAAWTRSYAVGGSTLAYLRDVLELPDGGYAMAGSADPVGSSVAEQWLVRADPDGKTCYDVSP